ncbi:MAG: efflux RND transporter periplasmic adaptor subunit [Ignavibacteriae bacterium]|nr:efflux RND transporter periplasmic adaptor subunit [Ignavibacteriota bacterium]
MKKILFGTAIAIVAVVTAFLLVASGSKDEEDVAALTTAVVQRRGISQSVIATGIIKPKVGAEVKVGAQVSGVVKDLFVKTGSKVKKGDLLALIDPRTYQSQKEKMFALREGAEAERKYAALELNRQKTLYEEHVVALQEFEATQQRFELSEAKLKQAEAEFKYAELQLGYTRILSPINGVVASISTQKGETVAAGFLAPTFVTIIDVDMLELWAYVDETDIGRIQKAQRVSFTVDTYPGEECEGAVETIYPKAEIQNNVVNYIVVVGIMPPKEKTLRPEMTATVQMFTQRKEIALVVPKNAIQTEDNRKFVTVLTGDRTEKRYVTTGISDKKYSEVLSGLSEKEEVVVR